MNMSLKNVLTSENKFPELKDGLQSNDLILSRITGKDLVPQGAANYEYESVNNEIIYYPDGNFYLIYDGISKTHYRLDADGNLDYEFKNPGRSTEWRLSHANAVLFEKDGFYKLDLPILEIQAYHEVINIGDSMEWEEWLEVFQSYYSQSENVLLHPVGDYNNPLDIIYFNQKDQWIKMKSPANKRVINPGTQPGERIGNRYFQEKITQPKAVYYLKDEHKKVYSNRSRTTVAELEQGAYTHSTIKTDNELVYPDDVSLKTISFKKEFSTSEGHYNPGIPVTFYGTGYYTLKWENRELNFHTKSTKTLLSKVDTKLKIFAAPLEYQNRTSVRFLAYDYDVNYNDNGLKGIYVVKPLRN